MGVSVLSDVCLLRFVGKQSLKSGVKRVKFHASIVSDTLEHFTKQISRMLTRSVKVTAVILTKVQLSTSLLEKLQSHSILSECVHSKFATVSLIFEY